MSRSSAAGFFRRPVWSSGNQRPRLHSFERRVQTSPAAPRKVAPKRAEINASPKNVGGDSDERSRSKESLSSI